MYNRLNLNMIEFSGQPENQVEKVFYLPKTETSVEKGGIKPRRFIYKLGSCFNGPWNFDGILIAKLYIMHFTKTTNV